MNLRIRRERTMCKFDMLMVFVSIALVSTVVFVSNILAHQNSEIFEKEELEVIFPMTVFSPQNSYSECFLPSFEVFLSLILFSSQELQVGEATSWVGKLFFSETLGDGSVWIVGLMSAELCVSNPFLWDQVLSRTGLCSGFKCTTLCLTWGKQRNCHLQLQ